jgi:hypothetical protein
MSPPLAQRSHPPTHWQTLSPSLPSDYLAIDFPRRAISPGEGFPIFFISRLGSGQGCPLLARIERAQFHRARSASTVDSPG